MSEQKLIKIQRVPSSAMIKLEVSGFYLRKLQHLLLSLSNQIKPEDLKAIFEKFHSTQEEPTDTVEAMIFVLTSLVGELEKKALEQNLVVTEEVNSDQLSKMFQE